SIFGRIAGAVEIVDAAISGFLVLVLDDRLDRPCERRIRPPLADVVPCLDQVPEMIDHAGARKERALRVDCDPPGAARALAPDFKNASRRLNPEDGASKWICLAIF